MSRAAYMDWMFVGFVWLDRAKLAFSLPVGYKTVLPALCTRIRCKMPKTALRKQNGKWLVIFEFVTSSESVFSYLCPFSHYFVLYTCDVGGSLAQILTIEGISVPLDSFFIFHANTQPSMIGWQGKYFFRYQMYLLLEDVCSYIPCHLSVAIASRYHQWLTRTGPKTKAPQTSQIYNLIQLKIVNMASKHHSQSQLKRYLHIYSV